MPQFSEMPTKERFTSSFITSMGLRDVVFSKWHSGRIFQQFHFMHHYFDAKLFYKHLKKLRIHNLPIIINWTSMQLFLLIHFQVLQALDRDKDGFITKKEFMMMNKAMTPTQVNAICCKLFPYLYVISFTNFF